jgi:hypothetical protein
MPVIALDLARAKRARVSVAQRPRSLVKRSAQKREPEGSLF